MSATDQDKRTVLFIGNRWINTIYNGYGVVKQRILLQIFEQLQGSISQVRTGKMRVSDFNIPRGHDYIVSLDMSRIVTYNNYFIVRRYLQEMAEQPIQIYNDPAYSQPIYTEAALLAGFDKTNKARMLTLRITKPIAELLLHIDYGWLKDKNKKAAYHYTMFDAETITRANSRYVHPLYTLMCSWGTKGGVTIKTDVLRQRLAVEAKYAGFDNFHRHVLKPVQTLLKIYGEYCFNYELVKEGKEIDRITFKVYKNKPAAADHSWKKIQALFQGENALPYFARMNPEDLEQLNYLLDPEAYNLDKVYTKLIHVHKQLIRKRENNEAAKSPFKYLWRSLTEQFPPPS